LDKLIPEWNGKKEEKRKKLEAERPTREEEEKD